MDLEIALVLGLALTAAAGAGQWRSARRRTTRTCSWCAEVSGFRVTGHDTRECRGYVQNLCRSRLRRMEATGRHEPNYWGDLWRLPEELASEPQPEH
ncbi:hypothetical protein ACIOJ9_28935 [Streptomyces sp. NPDC088175]|uniref:hypothetical protein n=1 Tax=unclassified Streptomyces TaxID=2593676 RepID=UPI003820D93C